MAFHPSASVDVMKPGGVVPKWSLLEEMVVLVLAVWGQYLHEVTGGALLNVMGLVLFPFGRNVSVAVTCWC